jgi:acetylglutamate/LysW-gamma-L-alpha-aminoadipate kinase
MILGTRAPTPSAPAEAKPGAHATGAASGRPAPALVVKLGGAAGLDFAAACQDAAALCASATPLVLVHGTSSEASELATALGHPPRWLTSPSGFRWRYTDRRTLEIFAMAARGKVNTLLVEALQAAGVNAIGLGGADGRLLQARRKAVVQSLTDGKRRIIRDDFTGKVERVNSELLRALLALGLTPVVAPLAISEANEVVNVDADRAAAMIAGALEVDTLVLLTAAPGLLRDYPDESSLVEHFAPAEVDRALALADAGMKKKVLGAAEALQAGVRRVIIADGRIRHPIASALAGGGTTFA